MKKRGKARRFIKPAKRTPLVAEAAPLEPVEPPRPWRGRLRMPVWYGFSALLLVFYFWTATSSNRPFHTRDTSREFYNLHTDALLKGHTYLDVKPAPQLLALRDPYDSAANEPWRLHDASLFRGRYYVYFGVVPAVALYVPWRLVTGSALSDDVAVTLFCMGGYVFSCLLLFLLLKATRTRAPWIVEAAAVIALGLGQSALMVLRRPRVYEVAVSSGYCFLAGGLYLLTRAMTGRGSGRWCAAGAAAMFGLAAGCRPHASIAAVFAAVVFGLYLARGRGLRGRGWLVEYGWLMVPLGAAGMLLAGYNYIRFGNPLEFGVTYQVGVISFAPGAGRQLSLLLRHVFASLYYFFFSLPNFMPRFPFVEMSAAAQPFGDPELYPPGYFHEPVAGVPIVAPLCLLSLSIPILLWRRPHLFTSGVRAGLSGLLVCAGAMFVSLLSLQGMSSRYELDFVPPLLVAGLFLCLFCSARLPARQMRTAWCAVTLAGCAWAGAANMGMSVNSYGYQLEQPYSALFRSIATRLGAGEDALMKDVESLHLDATITFPHARSETNEPILAAGVYERWNLLLVRYEPDGRGTLAYVECNKSDSWAPWIPLFPGKPQRMTVDYSRESKRIVVRLEGKTVLDFPAAFYPTARDEITIGRMRAGRFWLRDFSGKIELAGDGLKVVMRK